MRGMNTASTPEEQEGRADRVEVYSCDSCVGVTRYSPSPDPTTFPQCFSTGDECPAHEHKAVHP